MIRVFATLSLLALAIPAHAQSRSVTVGGDPQLDACTEFGFHKVMGLDPRGDGFLSVRSAPGAGNPEKDRLVNNTWVRVCEQSGDWFGIVYQIRSGDPTTPHDCGRSRDEQRRLTPAPVPAVFPSTGSIASPRQA